MLRQRGILYAGVSSTVRETWRCNSPCLRINPAYIALFQSSPCPLAWGACSRSTEMKIWMKAAVATLVLAMHAWGATAVLAGPCQPSVAEVRVGPLQTLWPDGVSQAGDEGIGRL